jgi:hypothetical protein
LLYTARAELEPGDACRTRPSLVRYKPLAHDVPPRTYNVTGAKSVCDFHSRGLASNQPLSTATGMALSVPRIFSIRAGQPNVKSIRRVTSRHCQIRHEDFYFASTTSGRARRLRSNAFSLAPQDSLTTRLGESTTSLGSPEYFPFILSSSNPIAIRPNE